MPLLSSRDLLRVASSLAISAPLAATAQTPGVTEDDSYLGTIVLGESKREVATDTAIRTTINYPGVAMRIVQRAAPFLPRPAGARRSHSVGIEGRG